jgi:hypothetical protein
MTKSRARDTAHRVSDPDTSELANQDTDELSEHESESDELSDEDTDDTEDLSESTTILLEQVIKLIENRKSIRNILWDELCINMPREEMNQKLRRKDKPKTFQSRISKTSKQSVESTKSKAKPMIVDLTSSPPAPRMQLSSHKRNASAQLAVEDPARKSSKKSKPSKSTKSKLEPFNCGRCGRLCTGKTHSKNGTCVYHDGYLEVVDDPDVWPDHDEDCHGRIDSTELRCDFPENYTWSCCGEDGNQIGCIEGEHRSGRKGHYAKLRDAGFRY